MVNDRGSGVFVRLSGENTASLLQNNIFVGRGNVNTGVAELRSNLAAYTAGLVNRESYDYRLTEKSPARDQGTLIESVGVSSTVPESEYVHVAGGKDREPL